MAKEIVQLGGRETSEELIRTLAYPKFALEEEDIEVLLGTYLPYVEAISVGIESLDKLPSCRDSEDQKFLLLAAKGKAEVLVTGDRALVELSGQTTFGIENPPQFKKRFF